MLIVDLNGRCSDYALFDSIAWLVIGVFDLLIKAVISIICDVVTRPPCKYRCTISTLTSGLNFGLRPLKSPLQWQSIFSLSTWKGAYLDARLCYFWKLLIFSERLQPGCNGIFGGIYESLVTLAWSSMFITTVSATLTSLLSFFWMMLSLPGKT